MRGAELGHRHGHARVLRPHEHDRGEVGLALDELAQRVDAVVCSRVRFGREVGLRSGRTEVDSPGIGVLEDVGVELDVYALADVVLALLV